MEKIKFWKNLNKEIFQTRFRSRSLDPLSCHTPRNLVAFTENLNQSNPYSVKRAHTKKYLNLASFFESWVFIAYFQRFL